MREVRMSKCEAGNETHESSGKRRAGRKPRGETELKEIRCSSEKEKSVAEAR